MGETEESGAGSMSSALIVIQLSESDFTLLREVIAKRAPELMSLLHGRQNVRLLGSQRVRIQSIVGDDLIETGFRDDDAPNDRGLALERIIDVLSPFR